MIKWNKNAMELWKVIEGYRGVAPKLYHILQIRIRSHLILQIRIRSHLILQVWIRSHLILQKRRRRLKRRSRLNARRPQQDLSRSESSLTVAVADLEKMDLPLKCVNLLTHRNIINSLIKKQYCENL